GGIASEEGAHSGFVGNDGGSVDAALRDVRVPSEDHLSLLDRSRVMPVTRHAGSFDERGRGVRERSDLAGQPEHFDVLGEPRPAFEAVLAGYNKLGIGEVERRAADSARRLVVVSRMMAGDAMERAGRGVGVSVEKILGLLLVLFEVGLIG